MKLGPCNVPKDFMKKKTITEIATFTSEKNKRDNNCIKQVSLHRSTKKLTQRTISNGMYG